MNKIFLIVVIVGVVICEDRAVRSAKDCGCDVCENPCDDSNEVRIHNKYWTQWETQNVSDRIVLICTPDSHFSSVVYDGCEYPQNTTCFGIERNTYYTSHPIYTGVNHNGRREPLYRKPITVTHTFNNGNAQRLQQTTLTDCECTGDSLIAFTDYVGGPDPLTGCCSEENHVNTLTAVYYKLQIFGKCCSTCYLQKSKIVYPLGINNNDANVDAQIFMFKADIGTGGVYFSNFP